jgi:hypothetical protein
MPMAGRWPHHSSQGVCRVNVFSSAWVYRFMRGALAVIFLHAGATKLLDPQAFAVLIDAYGIVPDALLMPVAVGLPLLEVVAAVGLMADIRGSLAVIAALLVIFMAILVYGIRIGLDVDCGCFGPEDIEARAYHGLRVALIRDAAMLAGVIYLYWCRLTDDFVKSSKFKARESRVTRRTYRTPQ